MAQAHPRCAFLEEVERPQVAAHAFSPPPDREMITFVFQKRRGQEREGGGIKDQMKACAWMFLLFLGGIFSLRSLLSAAQYLSIFCLLKSIPFCPPRSRSCSRVGSLQTFTKKAKRKRFSLCSPHGLHRSRPTLPSENEGSCRWYERAWLCVNPRNHFPKQPEFSLSPTPGSSSPPGPIPPGSDRGGWGWGGQEALLIDTKEAMIITVCCVPSHSQYTLNR